MIAQQTYDFVDYFVFGHDRPILRRHHDIIRQILTRMRSEYTRAHPALPAKETLTKDAMELLAAIQAMPDPVSEVSDPAHAHVDLTKVRQKAFGSVLVLK